MNIAVIAANGRSGRVFVELALAAGHHVRAGVYRRHSLTPHSLLTVVQCDATDSSDVNALIDNQDAVVSFIGHVKGSPERVQTNAMRVITAAMHERGVRRIVSLTGTGVRFPGDCITNIDRILNTAIRIIDPERIQDGKDHVELLQKTDLDWTIIRVLKLQNIQSKPFRLSDHGPTKVVVGRKEVAQAALQVLEQNTFVRAAPIISNR